jgi:hypothetical protein
LFAVLCERPRFLGRRDAVFLFQARVGSPSVVSSLFFVNALVADFDMQSVRAKDVPVAMRYPECPETIGIVSNAARLAADVTRCVADFSAPDEMSALIWPTRLHHNSY